MWGQPGEIIELPPKQYLPGKKDAGGNLWGGGGCNLRGENNVKLELVGCTGGNFQLLNPQKLHLKMQD